MMIKKIEIAKKLFLSDMQFGGEVFIPKELSQDQLPSSFRFYDFILNFVMNNICQET
jgi:hypothetical protein